MLNSRVGIRTGTPATGLAAALGPPALDRLGGPLVDSEP
jgi:hypothetical protein